MSLETDHYRSFDNLDSPSQSSESRELDNIKSPLEDAALLEAHTVSIPLPEFKAWKPEEPIPEVILLHHRKQGEIYGTRLENASREISAVVENSTIQFETYSQRVAVEQEAIRIRTDEQIAQNAEYAKVLINAIISQQEGLKRSLEAAASEQINRLDDTLPIAERWRQKVTRTATNIYNDSTVRANELQNYSRRRDEAAMRVETLISERMTLDSEFSSTRTTLAGYEQVIAGFKEKLEKLNQELTELEQSQTAELEALRSAKMHEAIQEDTLRPYNERQLIGNEEAIRQKYGELSNLIPSTITYAAIVRRIQSIENDEIPTAEKGIETYERMHEKLKNRLNTFIKPRLRELVLEIAKAQQDFKKEVYEVAPNIDRRTRVVELVSMQFSEIASGQAHVDNDSRIDRITGFDLAAMSRTVQEFNAAILQSEEETLTSNAAVSALKFDASKLPEGIEWSDGSKFTPPTFEAFTEAPAQPQEAEAQYQKAPKRKGFGNILKSLGITTETHSPETSIATQRD